MKILNIVLIFFSLLLSAQTDFTNFAKYEKENAVIKDKKISPNAVFMGDSISEGWFVTDPKFFTDHDFVGRGISGQTTSQMLLRFRQDVINLKPKTVIILAGTNDIAENTGPISMDKIFENLVTMSELAKVHHIKVVLCSLLPAYEFYWHKGLEPANKIIAMNKMLKDYANKNQIKFVNYFDEMKDGKNGLLSEYTQDEIHPNAKGYAVMEKILLKSLK